MRRPTPKRLRALARPRAERPQLKRDPLGGVTDYMTFHLKSALRTFTFAGLVGFGAGVLTTTCTRCLPEFIDTWHCGCVMFGGVLPNWVSSAAIVAVAAGLGALAWSRSRRSHAA